MNQDKFLAILIIIGFIVTLFVSSFFYSTPDTTTSYTVQKDDTIWGIATMYCPTSHTGNVVSKIERMNEIEGYIQPGQVLEVPVEPSRGGGREMVMLATAYDLSIHCCGKPIGHPSRGITADGTDINRLARDEAMVVATNDLPLGTKVELTFEGNRAKYNGIYTVRDTGGMRSNVIDVYVGDFGELIGSETGEFGRHWVKVVVVE